MGDALTGALADMVRSVLLVLPKALAFAAIVLCGWLVARGVCRVVDRVLHRAGFDEVAERGGVRDVLARFPYQARELVSKLAYFTMLLVTAQLAFGVWGPNPISGLIADIVGWLPRAFVAVVLIVVAFAVARAVKDVILGLLGDLSYGRMAGTVASAFIVGLGVIAALDQVGVASEVTTPVLIAVLAALTGVTIIGVGGGLVRPMQQRWDSLLNAQPESEVVEGRSRGYAAGGGHARDEQARDEWARFVGSAATSPEPTTRRNRVRG